ncbi:MAG: hypothetical protein GXP47_10610 [Acidobacteria bacterium]|nr:hypothetical protein [Acidobacteriota bacterium]
MQRLILADSHLGQRSGDVREMVALLERAREAGVGEIVFLGDVCQYLIGMSKLWTAEIPKLLSAWARLRDRGVRIVVVEGNRDFFLDEPEMAPFLDEAARRYEFTSGGVRFRLEHGDRINRRDYQYRFWAGISKCYPARVGARLLPRPLAVRIVESMEARLARTNRRFRYRKPVEDLVRKARGAWDEGVDVLFWGHFHTPWICTRRERTALIVPAWLEFDLGIRVWDDGRWGLVEKTLTPPTRLPTMERCP